MRRALLVIWLLTPTMVRAANPVGAAIIAKDWQRASAEAARESDPLAKDLVGYCRIIDQGDDDVSEIAALLHRHPIWPRQHALRQRLDSAIARIADDRTALALCDSEHPVADGALLRCAAAAKSVGRADAAQFARQAWRTGVATAAAEDAFLAQWAEILQAEDQWQRFDALDWAGDPAADRQEARLDAPRRALAAARLALRHGDPAAPALLRAVPESLQADPPLVLSWVRFLRAGQHYGAAVDAWRARGMTAEMAVGIGRRTSFWHERDRLARLLLPQGEAKNAFVLANDTAAGGDDTLESAFLAGWIALRRLNDTVNATRLFTALAAASPSVITQARAQFWLAEAAAGPAVSQHLQAAAAYPTTFYGQMAIARLAHAAATAGPDAGDSGAALRQALGKLANPGGTEAKLGVLDNAELIQAAKLFTAWGDTAHARQFLAHDVSLQQDGRFLGMIAATASQLGLIDVGVLAARRAGRFGVVLLDAGWPVPVGFSHEDKLALAVARQESNFDPGIVSPSGAQGLMQLMLGTAEDVRRGAGKPAASLNLFDPSVNIDIGTRYLDILLDEFGGVRPYAIAAYNAGPRHVREWLAANGDPASAPDMGAMADWVEQIPFGETRNYVERVLENLAIYNALLDKK